jgi:hypothetical protein
VSVLYFVNWNIMGIQYTVYITTLTQLQFHKIVMEYNLPTALWSNYVPQSGLLVQKNQNYVTWNKSLILLSCHHNCSVVCEWFITLTVANSKKRSYVAPAKFSLLFKRQPKYTTVPFIFNEDRSHKWIHLNKICECGRHEIYPT